MILVNSQGNTLPRRLKRFASWCAQPIFYNSISKSETGVLFAMANLGCAAFDSRGKRLALFLTSRNLQNPMIYCARSAYISSSIGRWRLIASISHFALSINMRGTIPIRIWGGRRNLRSLVCAREGLTGVLCVAFPRAVLGPHSPKVTDIARATHKQLDDVQYEADDEIVTPSDQLPLMDFVHIMGLRHAPERYWLVGRRIRDIGQLGAFGFVIEKGHPEDYR